MAHRLAAYILALAKAAGNTHVAADRTLYEKYLADAGVLLAHALTGMPFAELVPLLRAHDRLLGNTWVQGPEHNDVFAAWKNVIDHAADARAT